MATTSWIPSREQDFANLCDKWINIFGTESKWATFKWNAEEVGGVKQKIETYRQAYFTHKSGNSTANRIARDIARRDATAAMRMFANTSVRYNNSMNENDRLLLGIRPRDNVRTPIGEPDGIAEADIVYTGRMQLTVRVKHLEGTAQDKRSNYGCRIYYGVFAGSDAQPETGKDLRESRFTRLKKELFKFEPEDTGKTAWFCLRYENSRGRAGQWGPLVKAIIP
jgi:hypothetical protein